MYLNAIFSQVKRPLFVAQNELIGSDFLNPNEMRASGFIFQGLIVQKEAVLCPF